MSNYRADLTAAHERIHALEAEVDLLRKRLFGVYGGIGPVRIVPCDPSLSGRADELASRCVQVQHEILANAR